MFYFPEVKAFQICTFSLLQILVKMPKMSQKPEDSHLCLTKIKINHFPALIKHTVLSVCTIFSNPLKQNKKNI